MNPSSPVDYNELCLNGVSAYKIFNYERLHLRGVSFHHYMYEIREILY